MRSCINVLLIVMDFTTSGTTKKMFLDDTYLFTADALVVAFEKGEEENTGSLILDQTCFHAQGGGQPSDEGEIILSGGHNFTVKMVKTNEKQQLVHSGTSESAALWDSLAAGETAASLKVDESLRRKYARLHSAGHALDMAIRAVGYGERLVGVKGYHFLDSPNVEYLLKGEALTKDELDVLPGLLTAEMRRLVEADIPTIVLTIDKADVEGLCRDDLRNVDITNYPESIRMVSMCGMYIPCGGTHIKSSGEIGAGVNVHKIKKKKQMYKVSYTLGDQ